VSLPVTVATRLRYGARRLWTGSGWLAMLACAAWPVHAAGQDAEPVRATVFAAGDIADCRASRPAWSGAARTAALIAAGPADATVLTLGDHVYPVATPATLHGCYDATWGAFRARTRPAPGNHDYAGGSADAYYQYFGAQAGPPRRGYYSFELGNWRLYALNSHLKGPDHAAQLRWLQDELARHPARCTLAYWHVPLYSSGGHAADHHMRDTWRALHAAGAELVLSGHDHDYERFEPMDAEGRIDLPRGVRQFVVGTGGAYLTPFLWPEPGSAVRLNSNHGVLKLELLADGYRWQFLPADPVGYVAEFPEPPQQDSGSARCH